MPYIGLHTGITLYLVDLYTCEFMIMRCTLVYRQRILFVCTVNFLRNSVYLLQCMYPKTVNVDALRYSNVLLLSNE